MCFMRDLSILQSLPTRTTSDGGIDFDHYRMVARQERLKAQRTAFTAVGQWLRRSLHTIPTVRHTERLG